MTRRPATAPWAACAAALSLLLAPIPVFAADAATPISLPPTLAVASALAAPGDVRVVKPGGTARALTVRWRPVDGADGYRVYLWDHLARKYVPEATINGGDRDAFTAKSLAPGRVYRFALRAFHAMGGHRLWSPLSWWASARTWRKGDHVVNATEVQILGGDSLSLGGTGWYHGRALAGQAPTPTPPPVPVGAHLRFEVLTGQNVLSLTRDGRVTALAPGLAQIRAVAHNGRYRTLTVRVANYARVGSLNPDARLSHQPEVTALLATLRDQVADLTTYLVAHRVFTENPVALGDDGRLAGWGKGSRNLDATALRLLEDVITNYPYWIAVKSWPREVVFSVRHLGQHNELGECVTITFEPGMASLAGPDPSNYEPLAPHWSAIKTCSAGGI